MGRRIAHHRSGRQVRSSCCVLMALFQTSGALFLLALIMLFKFG